MGQIAAGNEQHPPSQPLRRPGYALSETIMLLCRQPGKANAYKLQFFQGQMLPQEIQRYHRAMIQAWLPGPQRACRDILLLTDPCQFLHEFLIVCHLELHLRRPELPHIAAGPLAR